MVCCNLVWLETVSHSSSDLHFIQQFKWFSVVPTMDYFWRKLSVSNKSNDEDVIFLYNYLPSYCEICTKHAAFVN